MMEQPEHCFQWIMGLTFFMHKNEQKSLLKDTKWIAGSLYIAKAISVPCSILTAKILDPFYYGTISTLRLIISYSAFLQIGIFDGLTREIPYAVGNKQNEEIKAYKSSTFTISIVVAALASTALLAASMFVDKQAQLMITGLRVVAAVIFFSHLYSFYQYLLKAEQKFVLFSSLRTAYIAGGAVLQLVGVIFLGINGVFYAMILINMAIAVFLVFKIRIKITIPKLDALKPLFRSGFPMMLNGSADTMFTTADRLMIVLLLGRTQLGYYAIAILVASLLEFIPTAIQSALLPRLIVKASGMIQSQDMMQYWFNPIKITTGTMLIVGGIGWIVAPLGIVLFLPKYVPGIIALKVLIYGSCFSSIVSLTRNNFVAFNKQYRVLVAFVIFIIFGIILNIVLIKLHFGISGVAVATATSYLLLGLTLVYMTLIILDERKLLPKFMGIYFPILLSIVFLVALDYFFPYGPDIYKNLLYIAIKLSLYLCILILVQKKFGFDLFWLLKQYVFSKSH